MYIVRLYEVRMLNYPAILLEKRNSPRPQELINVKLMQIWRMPNVH